MFAESVSSVVWSVTEGGGNVKLGSGDLKSESELGDRSSVLVTESWTSELSAVRSSVLSVRSPAWKNSIGSLCDEVVVVCGKGRWVTENTKGYEVPMLS